MKSVLPLLELNILKMCKMFLEDYFTAQVTKTNESCVC